MTLVHAVTGQIGQIISSKNGCHRLQLPHPVTLHPLKCRSARLAPVLNLWVVTLGTGKLSPQPISEKRTHEVQLPYLTDGDCNSHHTLLASHGLSRHGGGRRQKFSMVYGTRMRQRDHSWRLIFLYQPTAYDASRDIMSRFPCDTGIIALIALIA